MSEPIVYKPGTSKGTVILLNYDTNTAPSITLKDGTVITAKKAGQGAPGVYKGDNGYQWVFPSGVEGQESATLTVDGKSQEIGNTNKSWRGNSIGSLTESNKVGSSGGSLGTGPYAPGKVGDFGVAPAYIGDKFPEAVTTQYDNIESAPYQYIDPIKFGQDFNPSQRQEYSTNYKQGGDLALDSLNVELQGLKNFSATAAGLKRDVITSDNIFNRNERTAAVDANASDVRSDLNNQAEDFRAYARGEVPDAVLDNALGVSSRSASASASTAAGFGTNSLAAGKISNLMAVKDRLALAQYGNSGLAANANARLALNLPETEYSNAGGQISAVPSLSASQLQQSNFGSINNGSILSAATAFTTNVNQSQFVTGQEQSTRTFNATNNLNNDQFNATNQNNFALSFFNYLNSYVNSLASAGQTSVNTGVEIDQQNQNRDIYNDNKNKTQKNNEFGSDVTGTLLFGPSYIPGKKVADKILGGW